MICKVSPRCADPLTRCPVSEKWEKEKWRCVEPLFSSFFVPSKFFRGSRLTLTRIPSANGVHADNAINSSLLPRPAFIPSVSLQHLRSCHPSSSSVVDVGLLGSAPASPLFPGCDLQTKQNASDLKGFVGWFIISVVDPLCWSSHYLYSTSSWPLAFFSFRYG